MCNYEYVFDFDPIDGHDWTKFWAEYVPLESPETAEVDCPHCGKTLSFHVWPEEDYAEMVELRILDHLRSCQVERTGNCRYCGETLHFSANPLEDNYYPLLAASIEHNCIGEKLPNPIERYQNMATDYAKQKGHRHWVEGY